VSRWSEEPRATGTSVDRRRSSWRVRAASFVVAAIATALVAASPASAAYPGQNGRIVFDRFTVDWEMFSIRPNGRGLRDLTPAISPAQHGPAVSADGRKVAFARNGILIMNIDGSDRRRLTTGSDSNPYFSPNRGRIVFEREVGGDSEIFVIGVNGTGARNLTQSPTTDDHNPSYSPNGRRIVFESFRTSTPVFGVSRNIIIMDSDGTDQRPLTGAANMNDFSPDFSPNNRRVVFARDTDFDGASDELFDISAGGMVGTHRALTTTPIGPLDEQTPAYSPNGRRIVFTVGQSGGIPAGRMFTIGRNGGGRTVVPNSPRRVLNPSWGPAL
jgi:TolB protein